MPSAELTITHARQEPVVGATAPYLSRPRTGVGAQPTADRGRGRAVFRAVARGLRRALAGSARAWALAAGVPPDLYT